MSSKSKKDDLRFSLRMNPCDPVQVQAANILNTKGHRISDFVARAIITFVNLNSPEETVFSAPKSQVKAIINPSVESDNEKSTIQKESNNKSDSIRSMLDGLGELNHF